MASEDAGELQKLNQDSDAEDSRSGQCSSTVVVYYLKL